MNQEFEKYSKEVFQNHEVDVDVEALWMEIEPKVREKKDRKIIWWFFPLGLAVSILLLLIWNRVTSDSVAIQRQVTKEQEHSNHDSKTYTYSEQSTNVDPKKETNELVTSKPASSTSEQKSSSTTTGTTNSASTFKNRTNVFAPSSPQALDTSALAESELNAESKAVEHLTSLPIPSSLDQQKENQISESIKLKGPIYLASLRMDQIEVAFNENLDSISEEAIISSTAVPLVSRAKTKYGIGLYAGYGRPFQTLSVSPNVEGDADYNARVNTEIQLEALQLGLNFITQIKGNFSIRTGLEYNRLARRFNKSILETTFDTIPNSITEIRINTIRNDTMFIMGSVVNTTASITRKEAYNYLHLIDVPFLIGYQLHHNQWSFGIEAGLIANLLLTTKGTISTANGTDYDLKTDARNWYQTRVSIAPLIHLNLQYQINEHFYAYTSPFYRFKSVYSTTQNPLIEKYSTIGLQSGVRYYF